MFTRCLATIAAGLVAVSLSSCSKQSGPAGPVIHTATIDNVQPRRDTDGHIIDAHGGCIQYFNGLFYLYGTAYGTNLNSLDPRDYFVAYSSPDLQQWKLEGRLIPNQPEGVYTRPYVIYNATTHKYVLWYNWFPKLWEGQAGVAMSDSPTGPFTVVNPAAHLHGHGPGDGSLFRDDDGTAYYIYTSMKENYTVRVEKLTPDYSDVSGEVGDPFVLGTEAPVMLRHGATYYVLVGSLCPDCPEGTEVYVLTATNPLAQFMPHLGWNLNRRSEAGAVETKAGTPIVTVENKTTMPNIPAQQTWVLKMPGDGEPVFIWMGDRWGSTPDGQKGHDFQYWSPPMEFDVTGRLMPLQNVPKWTITW